MVLCKHITLVYDVVCVWHSTEEWCGGAEKMPCMKSFELGKEMGEKRKVEENFSSFAVDE